MESLMLLSMAVVAAPMQKEWPSNWDGLKPPVSWLLRIEALLCQWPASSKPEISNPEYFLSKLSMSVMLWLGMYLYGSCQHNILSILKRFVLEAFGLSLTTCALWIQSTDTSEKLDALYRQKLTLDGTVNSSCPEAGAGCCPYDRWWCHYMYLQFHGWGWIMDERYNQVNSRMMVICN